MAEMSAILKPKTGRNSRQRFALRLSYPKSTLHYTAMQLKSRNRHALISVSDKTGIAAFARSLVEEHGYAILSTGNTARLLRAAGVEAVEVSEYTGFPEMMDGRIKTLHPKVHGGLLCRRDREEHLAEAERSGIALIDIVVVNLYPFEQTIAVPGVSLEDAIENIDIGGPSMLRSAAKNHASVMVICDTLDYDRALHALRHRRQLHELRKELALKAFRRTADYDASISSFLAARYG